jgi:hypothetical protein
MKNLSESDSETLGRLSGAAEIEVQKLATIYSSGGAKALNAVELVRRRWEQARRSPQVPEELANGISLMLLRKEGDETIAGFSLMRRLGEQGYPTNTYELSLAYIDPAERGHLETLNNLIKKCYEIIGHDKSKVQMGLGDTCLYFDRPEGQPMNHRALRRIHGRVVSPEEQLATRPKIKKGHTRYVIDLDFNYKTREIVPKASI